VEHACALDLFPHDDLEARVSGVGLRHEVHLETFRPHLLYKRTSFLTSSLNQKIPSVQHKVLDVTGHPEPD
jgi:hypothetical protein